MQNEKIKTCFCNFFSLDLSFCQKCDFILLIFMIYKFSKE